MKDETKLWLAYSEENLKSAKLLIESHLYNPVLQNVQQCVEKTLKSILLENSIKLKRTHDIFELKTMVSNIGIDIALSDDECDFLNSIYLPSKYPIGSSLPEFDPDEKICAKAIKIAESTLNKTNSILK